MRRFYPAFIGMPGSVGLLVLRLVAGSALMLHGWPKMQSPFAWMGTDAPVPGFLQALAALSEFGGGLAMLIGLLTPLACLGILATMGTAVTMVHLAKGDPFVAPHGWQGGSYELALVYFSVALTVLLAGPGKLCVDYLLLGRPSEQKSETEKKPEVPTSA
ncbi:MAG TPA: DoxX family protein [Candidatus Obscuribacterales bacterium]